MISGRGAQVIPVLPSNDAFLRLRQTGKQVRALALLLLAASMMWGDAQQSGASPSLNPDTLKSLSLEDLSQIVVTTPSKEPVTAMKTPAAIYVITGEDIRRYGARTIPDALRLAPGVEVAQIDGSNWSVGIRGFGSDLTRSVLVMIDGRTVYTPLFAGTNWDAQNVMMEDIDRIEVIRGPGGTIWGPNAVNGVINIITKSSKETQGWLASAGGGNIEQGFANLRYGGGNGKDFSYRVYGMGFTNGPEFHPNGVNFDDWRNVQGGFRMDWAEKRDTFTLQGDAYDEIAGKSVTANTYAPPYTQNVDANALLSGENILGRWQRVFSDGNDIQVQAYFDRVHRITPNYEENRDTYDVDYLQRARCLGGRSFRGAWPRVDPVNDPLVVTGLQFFPFQRTDYLVTGFVQDEIGLVDQRLSSDFGNENADDQFHFRRRLRAQREAVVDAERKADDLGAVTHALRTPSDSEENFSLAGYTGSSIAGLPLLARFGPNPDFAPEQLNGYELGYRRVMRHHFFVDVTGFYNHYHDLFSEDLAGSIFLETTPAPPHYLIPAQFRNDLLGYTKGLEIAPEWRPTENWRLRGSYSFLHMNLAKKPGSGDLGTAPIIAGSSPQHEATLQSAFDVSKRIQLDLTYRYVDGLPGLGIHAYSTGDARIGYRFNSQWDLSFVGQNLFRPWIVQYSSDPGLPLGISRSVYAKMTWSK